MGTQARGRDEDAVRPPWAAVGRGPARRGHREDAGGPAPHGLSCVGGVAP